MTATRLLTLRLSAARRGLCANLFALCPKWNRARARLSGESSIMNLFLSQLLAVIDGAPIMVKILFWVLLVLWAVGGVGFRDNPGWVRGNSIVIVILLAILGFFTFGF